jgi:RHS repeat-associated protein
VKKTENVATTYYLRSTVLGGQVVAEIDDGGAWQRGYVYLGSQTIAIQHAGVNWVHQDPVTKSQRVTNSSGTVTSTVDLDPWGGETNRSANSAFQPHKYTTYERDANGGDEAMHRRYQSNWHRFSQPDPYDGSYSLTDPQSFNRYAYVNNDPANFTDPSGLNRAGPGTRCVIEARWKPHIEGGGDWYLQEVCFGESENWGSIGIGGFGSGLRRQPQDVAPQPQQETCGVNPITGRAGFNPDPRGVPGNLRPGVGGQGHFGARRRRGTHQGLDVSGVSGESTVYSNRAGTVTFAGVAGDAGNLVIVDHGGGVLTRYGHLDSFAAGLEQGGQVNQGSNLGIVGQTGNARGQLAAEAHVHFGVQVNGRNVDPAIYLNSRCP